ncbi:MAG: hypothetical protein R8L58_03055, partial [Mariprofundaceae bacterium]
MKLRSKVNYLSLVMTLVLAVFLAAGVNVLIGKYSEDQARKQGHVVVAMAKIGLLHTMHESIAFSNDEKHVRNEIDLLFNGFAAIPELLEMRALRGEAVVRQYGKSIGRGAIEPLEQLMLDSGQPSEHIGPNEDGIKVFHYNGALIATSTGSQNCLSCHDVAEGTVLGGLSVQVDISDAEAAISKAIYQLIALLLLLGILFALGLRRIFLPMLDVVGQVRAAFMRASVGDFSHRVNYAADDEIGEVAQSTNTLMQSLDEHVGAIARDVEGLTGSVASHSNEQPMQHMASVVHNLTAAV